MPQRRFFVPDALVPGSTLTLPAALQHRLAKVLRLGQGDAIALCNGRSPLYAATVADAKCRTALVAEVLVPFTPPTPLTLALAIPKREAWESALRQATELGATAILPLKTEFSQVARINEERALTILTEAAEQSERLTLPTLAPVQSLTSFLSRLSQPVAWAYERADASHTALPEANTLLIGPEGGFSPEEVAELSFHPHLRPFSLGHTILRVDTAVVSALALLARRS